MSCASDNIPHEHLSTSLAVLPTKRSSDSGDEMSSSKADNEIIMKKICEHGW